MPVFRLLLGIALMASLGSGAVRGQEPPATPAQQNPPVSFSRQIAPLLVEKCIACHGPKNPESEYRLDSYEQLIKNGASGEPTVVPGKPKSSLLYRLVNSDDEEARMPQEGKALPAEQIALVSRWIEEGGKYDGPSPSASLQSILPKAVHPAPPVAYPPRGAGAGSGVHLKRRAPRDRWLP